jgi:NhaP-type Na+/H+ or K+/H+ antiporter
LVIGWLGGGVVAALIRRLQRAGRPIEQVEFLVLGLIALLYGAALALQTYGFLAVFAGGLALGRAFQRDDGLSASGTAPQPSLRTGVVAWTAQSERLCEVALVLLVGVLLGHTVLATQTLIYAALLMLVVRPLAVLLSAPGRISAQQRRLISWFGIRGIGSLYYLAFALDHGVPTDVARTITDAALITIAVSIALHGISATPLMDWYERRRA